MNPRQANQAAPKSPPRGCIGATCWRHREVPVSSSKTTPYPAQRRSTEGPQTQQTRRFEPNTPANSSPHRAGLWLSGSSDEGVLNPAGSGRGEKTYRRYLQVAPMGALGAVSAAAHFACLGELRSPLVSLPRRSSSGHNSPPWLFFPLRRLQRGAVLGHRARGGRDLNGASCSAVSGLGALRWSRSQARSAPLVWSTGALARPELGSLARGGVGRLSG